MIDQAAQTIGGQALSLDPGELAVALDPQAIVAARKASGGAAPDVVAAMAEQNAQEARRQVTQATEQLAKFAEVEEALVGRVEDFLASGTR